MSGKPNIVFFLADQLRASSLPAYGEQQIETPNIDRLTQEGVTFSNAISSCPVCVPYRSMLMTGRHPQTTGHVINFIQTRHDEVGLGDIFGQTGYKTGYIGKWHLHTGSFPEIQGRDYVPEGRDRLGFDYWRAYNFHMNYFDGWIHKDDWRSEQWGGYETQALTRYTKEFLEGVGEDPFCLFVSPHQPHYTPLDYAPAKYYDRLPSSLVLPENVSESMLEESLAAYRHYLAMILAIDEMLGELLDDLERLGKAQDTIVVFTSDHGSQFGAHDYPPWAKKKPYEESIHVPLIVRYPGVMSGGTLNETLLAPVDFLPTLCGLCGLPIPDQVEGLDLSEAWTLRETATCRDAVLTMNFGGSYDYLHDGTEWRGVRTKEVSYYRSLQGEVGLFRIQEDPLQLNNLALDPAHLQLVNTMEKLLQELLENRHDSFEPASFYRTWFDAQRRVIRNAKGPLPHPESVPGW